MIYIKKFILFFIPLLVICSLSLSAFAADTFSLYYYNPKCELYDTLGNIDTSGFSTEEKAFFTEWVNNRYTSKKYLAVFCSCMTAASDNLSGQNEYIYQLALIRLNSDSLYLESNSSMPVESRAFPYVLCTKDNFTFMVLYLKSVTSPKKINECRSFVMSVSRGVCTADKETRFFITSFLTGLSSYNNYAFLDSTQQSYLNSTVVNLLIDDKTTRPLTPPPPQSSSISTSPFNQMPFPTIPKSSDPWVFYDTTVWNQFLSLIKYYANVAISAGMKIFWFVLSMIVLASIFHIVRTTNAKGDKS